MNNKPCLVALEKCLEVEKIKAQTGIYPDSTKVSSDYLFGNSESIGEQQEFKIMQCSPQYKKSEAPKATQRFTHKNH